ncbi:MAG: zeta toxin family protein [Bacteroidales bacterium]|nr:zeta toxin family protein [Clostridium sp.]MCM1202833.1 zeta toxin family protein [Bacteroidales bacterium]
MRKIPDDISSERFEAIYKDIYINLTMQSQKSRQKCTYILGGQPGSGKSTFYSLDRSLQGFIVIDGDEYRKYHPQYIDIVKNDMENISQRTQAFSNAVVERLISDLGNDGYNLIIEGTLRNPEVPIKTCIELNEKGYKSNLVIVACSAKAAWEATICRAEKMKRYGGYPRFVPIEIYHKTVNNIVESLNQIVNSKCFDNISIFDRTGKTLYPNQKNLCPAEILMEELHLDDWNANFDVIKEKYEDKKRELLEYWSIDTGKTAMKTSEVFVEQTEIKEKQQERKGLLGRIDKKKEESFQLAIKRQEQKKLRTFKRDGIDDFE